MNYPQTFAQADDLLNEHFMAVRNNFAAQPNENRSRNLRALQQLITAKSALVFVRHVVAISSDATIRQARTVLQKQIGHLWRAIHAEFAHQRRDALRASAQSFAQIAPLLSQRINAISKTVDFHNIENVIQANSLLGSLNTALYAFDFAKNIVNQDDIIVNETSHLLMKLNIFWRLVYDVSSLDTIVEDSPHVWKSTWFYQEGHMQSFNTLPEAASWLEQRIAVTRKALVALHAKRHTRGIPASQAYGKLSPKLLFMLRRYHAALAAVYFIQTVLEERDLPTMVSVAGFLQTELELLWDAEDRL